MKKKKTKQQSWPPVPTHDEQGNRLSNADLKQLKKMQGFLSLLVEASSKKPKDKNIF